MRAVVVYPCQCAKVQRKSPSNHCFSASASPCSSPSPSKNKKYFAETDLNKKVAEINRKFELYIQQRDMLKQKNRQK